jgi:hypothetical protein
MTFPSTARSRTPALTMGEALSPDGMPPPQSRRDDGKGAPGRARGEPHSPQDEAQAG